MNKVILVGRITKDPELKKTNSDIPYVQFTIAVNRLYQNKNGEKQADFINCIAWRSAAELLARYIKKGNQIGVDGQIQTRNYDDQNGVRHFITEVMCENIHFLEPKRQEDNGGYPFNDISQPSNQGNNQYGQPGNYNQNNYQNNQKSYQRPNNQPVNQSFKNEIPREQKKPESPFDDIDSQFDISNDDLPF